MAATERLSQYGQILMRRQCGARIHALLLSCGWEHTKMDKKTADVRRLLIEFARLSALQRNQFLETLNLFMYASPQRRRKIMLQWESIKSGLDTD